MTYELIWKLHRALVERCQRLRRKGILLLHWFRAQLTGPGRMRSEAMQWVITLDSCEDVAPFLPNFRCWLSARSDNRATFAELWDFWQELGTLQDRNRWRAPNLAQGPACKPSAWGSFPWRAAVGFALASTILLNIVVYLSQTPALATGWYFSGINGRDLSLTDGSTIGLQPKSQVTLDLGIDRRHVQLDEGEARFQVASNSALVFEVSVANARVLAVGTAFVIRKSGPFSARVEVIEHAVDLVLANGEPIRVAAGQAAEFDRQMIRVNRPAPAGGTTPETLLIFRGEPLGEVAREFNRYNLKCRILVDDALAGQPFRGQFLATNPRGFANTIHINWGIKPSTARDAMTGVETIQISKGGPYRQPATRYEGSDAR